MTVPVEEHQPAPRARRSADGRRLSFEGVTLARDDTLIIPDAELIVGADGRLELTRGPVVIQRASGDEERVPVEQA